MKRVGRQGVFFCLRKAKQRAEGKRKIALVIAFLPLKQLPGFYQKGNLCQ